MDGDEQDRIWLLQVATGGIAAQGPLSELYRKYRTPLIVFLARRGFNQADADEVVQDTFIRIVNAAGGFRSEARVTSWIHQIARNLALDRIRGTREGTFDDDGWAIIEKDFLVTDNDETERVTRVVDCLYKGLRRLAVESPAHAEALYLVVAHQWSTQDLAHFLGRTDTATRQFLVQCRRKLTPHVEQCRQFLKGGHD